jgi:hypothetical protein
MAEFAILIVRTDNATVTWPTTERRNVMFDAIELEAIEDELLDLAVTERGHTAPGHALAAFPLCCSLVLVLSCSCSRAEPY